MARDEPGHIMSELDAGVIKCNHKVKSKLTVGTKADFDTSR